MKLSEMHVGQTVFVNGNRDNWWVVTGFGEAAFLAKFHNEGKERGYITSVFEPIPHDLHDKDGKPLKMGDKVRRTICFQYSGVITGVEIHNSDIWIRALDDARPGTTTITVESLLEKVEPVETVDDVRKYYQGYDWYVTDAIERAIKATRAEYEK